MSLTSELNNVLISLKNYRKIHINKFLKIYYKVTNNFISKKILINYLNNNEKIILYKNTVIIDNLEVEPDYLEDLNIDFIFEPMVL